MIRPGSTTLRFALAFLGYTALTLLLFHGLIGRFSTAVPHDLGDPLLSAWVLWWNAHHLPFVGAWWDGLSFYPGHGSLAFSDHRVGLTLIAGPIQWLGGTPVLAYNVTLLSSFVFCALAAHALTWLLTRSHAAGTVSGLIFGFNPFRISHIAHLELLAVFWLPLAFAALHLYVRRFEVRWLVAFAVLWALQGLSSGYYLFYSAPVIGLWAIWFAREKPWRGIGAIMLACGVVFLALLPVLLGYRAIQDRLLLTRSFAEIESFSADITGILSATPIMALWRVPSLASNGEAEIYLGIFAPLLVAAALAFRRGSDTPGAPRWHALRLVVATVGAMYALIAAGTLLGPWSVRIGPLTVSASQTVQPLSIAVLCLIVLGLTSPSFVDAFRRRSVFAFYTVATVMTWGFTLGPRPRLLGELLLYRGPYELLMLFPGFGDRLRVPARFVMMTILAVAIAAGIALIRLTASAPRAVRVAATILVLVAITADSWTFTCPMPAVPPFVELPGTVPESAAVLELPLGNVGTDIAAVYRSVAHGHPVVNGYSGYEPPHYRVLKPGLGERDDSVLTALTKSAPIVVMIAREDDPGRWSGGLCGTSCGRGAPRGGRRPHALSPAPNILFRRRRRLGRRRRHCHCRARSGHLAADSQRRFQPRRVRCQSGDRRQSGNGLGHAETTAGRRGGRDRAGGGPQRVGSVALDRAGVRRLSPLPGCDNVDRRPELERGVERRHGRPRCGRRPARSAHCGKLDRSCGQAGALCPPAAARRTPRLWVVHRGA